MIVEEDMTCADDSSVQRARNILLVDDHPVFRRGLVVVFSELWPEFVLSEAGNVEQAQRIISAQERIDLILLDLRMPGVSGYDALKSLLAVAGDTPIVIISSLESPDSIRETLAVGANGYILKSSSAEVLKHAVSLVMAGELYVPAGALAAEGPDGEPPNFLRHDGWRQASSAAGVLTRRQTEVLRLMGKGMSNKEIARALGMLEGTVKVHAREILHRLPANNRTHAVVTAARLGIIPPTDQL